MNTTTFFHSINDHLNEKDQLILIESINQDPLIQSQIINPEFFQQCVDFFGESFSKWSLGKVACLSLGIKPEILKKDVNEKYYLKKSISLFDNHLRGMINDLDIQKAAYIALALFERKRKNQSWDGVLKELSSRQPRIKLLPNWRTVLAILFSLLDYDEKLLLALVDDSDPYLGISFINHIISAQFLSRKEKANQIVRLIEKLSIENQIAWVQSIPGQLPQLANDIGAAINSSSVLTKNLFLESERVQEGQKTLFDGSYKVNLLNSFIHQIDESPVQAQSNLRIAKEKIKKVLRFIDLNLVNGNIRVDDNDLSDYLNEPYFQDLLLESQSNEELVTGKESTSSKGIIAILDFAKSIQKRGDISKAREIAANQFKIWLDKLVEAWPSPEIITYLSNLNHKKIIESLELLGLNGLGAEYVIFLHSLPMLKTTLKEQYVDALVSSGKYEQAYQELKATSLFSENRKEVYKQIFTVLKNAGDWSSLFMEWGEYANQFALSHEDWIQYANSALNANQVDKTQSILEQMGNEGVEQLQINILQGKLFYKLGEFEKARSILEDTTKQLPNFADGWIVLSDVYSEMGNFEKSMETLRSAVLAIPDSDEINYKLAKICLDQELFAESLPYIRKANALNPNQPVYVKQLIQTLQMLGRNDEADAILNQARLKWTKDPEIAYLDAVRQVEKQNRDLALAAFDVAINSNVAIVPTERIKLYVQTILGDQKDKFLPTDGKYNAINHLLSAQKYLKIILADAPEDEKYYQLVLSEVYYLIGEYETANLNYSKLINEFKEDEKLNEYLWRAYAGFGLVKIGLKEFDSGIAALEEADLLKPQHLGIKQKCAEAYISANLMNKAELKADEIYELGSTQIDNLIWYSDFMNMLKKKENEIKGLEQILHFDPSNPFANTRLTEIYISIGKIDEAYELINKMSNLVDLEEKDIRSIVISLMRLGKYEDALTWFSKLSSPNNEIELKYRRFEKTYLLLTNEIWSKALSEIQQLKSIGLNNYISSSLEGYTLYKLGDFSAAVNAFETSLILPKENLSISISDLVEKTIIPEAWLLKLTDELEIYTYLTKSYNNLNDYDHSLEVINRMVRVNPSNLWNYVWGAENAVQLTDYDLATDYLMKLKKAAKENDWQNTEEIAAALEYSCAYLDGRDYKLTIKKPEYSTEIWKLLQAHQLLDSQRFGDAHDLYQEVMIATSEIAKELNGVSKTEYSDLKNSIYKRLRLLLAWRLYDFGTIEKLLDYQNEKKLNIGTVEDVYLRLSIDFSYQKISKLFDLFEVSDRRSKPIENEVTDTKAIIELTKKMEKFSQTKAVRNIISIGELVATKNPTLSTDLLNSNHLPEYFKFVIVDELMKADARSKVEEYINNHHCKPLEYAFYLINVKDQSTEVINGILYGNTSDDPMWLMLSSKINEEFGNLDEAIELGEQAFGIWQNENNWLVRLAKMNQKAGNLDKAEAFWIEVIHREQNSEKYVYEFADLLLENNKAKETLELLEEYKQKITNSPNLHITKAKAFIQEKSVDELRNEIKLARELGEKSLEIDYLEANAKYLEGKTEQALIKIQEILLENPVFLKAHTLNAKILREDGKYNEAIREINKSLQVCPDDKLLLIEKAMNLKMSGEVPEGLLIASELSQKYPGDTKILNLLANLYNDIDDIVAAEKVARKSLSIDGNQSDIHKLLGQLAKKQGHLDQALDHLSKAALINEMDVEAWVEMGDIYVNQNETEKALNAYREACNRDDKNYLAFYKSGLLLRDLKDYQGAEKMLRIASELSPKDASIRRQLAGVIALNLVHSA